AASGDRYPPIRLAPQPTSERRGRDLYTKVPISLTTEVLGGEADAQTLGGKSRRLKIPPTTQSGQVFRLKGHGMAAIGKMDNTGEMYEKVTGEHPGSLTSEQ